MVSSGGPVRSCNGQDVGVIWSELAWRYFFCARFRVSCNVRAVGE
jgi:hypothetical protein